MHRTCWRLLLLLACAGLLGCQDSGDALARQEVEVLAEFAETLKSVQDEATAKAAEPKVQELSFRLRHLNEKFDELKVSTEGQKELEQKYEKSIKESVSAITAEMARIKGLNLPAETQRLLAIPPEATAG